MMATSKAAKKTRKRKETRPIKFAVPLPPEVHRALRLASVDTGRSNSTLICELVAQRFETKPKRELKLLARAGRNATAWKRVSVFLPRDLREAAKHEVSRQHGNPEDKRFSGSLAAAIAALVAEQYAPNYPF